MNATRTAGKAQARMAGDGKETTNRENDMNKKATAKEKKSFSRRFSLERWMELCNNGEFCAAFEAGDLELAATIASR